MKMHTKHITSYSRRVVLKGLVGMALTVTAFPFTPYASFAAGHKTLIVYFSRTGNTRQLAEMIHKRIGGDMVELKIAKPYPQDYDAVTKQAKKEQQENARPAFVAELPPLDGYSTVFLGYPNWWGTMPMVLFTFLEKNDFSGKTIIPFCTHGGSRLGRSVDDIKALCPKATVRKGFSAFGNRVGEAAADVDAWLHGLGIATVK